MPSIAIPVSLRGQLLYSTRIFDPLSLFAANEPGIWLDPSDLTTMFQDRAGTTAVTTPGQSVGLRLDKSKGLVLGSELVTNGDFSAGSTGWTTSGTGTPNFTGNTFAFTGASGLVATNTGTVSASRWYKYSYQITTAVTGGFVQLFVGGTASGGQTAVGTYSGYLLSNSTAVSVQAFGAGTIDNISVKELPGNHAVANSDAARGIYGIEPLGGRRNLLTFTEQFDNAAWTKANVTVTSNAGVAPDGTTTADKLIEAVGVFRGRVEQAISVAVGNTLSVYAKAAEWNRVCIGTTNALGLWGIATFNLSTGLVDGGASYGGSSVDTATITPVGNGWYRCSVRIASGTDRPVIMPFNQSGDPVIPSPSLVGDGTSGILIWGAQLETGSTATAYQRVTTQYDVTEAGKQTLHYVQYDGSDDGYVTPTITPGIDKVQVFAGVRKLSDAAVGTVLEFSDSSDANNGAFFLRAPQAVAANYIFRSKGTVTANAISPSSYAAPITNVLTGLGDIAGDVSRIRVNGAQVTETLTDQGTGNFLAYPLYIGRRGAVSTPFNGRDYGICVRFGANLDASTISATEAWLAGKTGVTI